MNLSSDHTHIFFIFFNSHIRLVSSASETKRQTHTLKYTSNYVLSLTLLQGLLQGLHIWAYFSGRELPKQTPPG